MLYPPEKYVPQKKMNCTNPGKIQIVTGPMFASKSSFLLAQIRREKIIGTKCMIIGWSGDQRSQCYLKTHNYEKIRATLVTNLKEIFSSEEYQDSTKLFIDEGHFFADLCDSVLLMAHRDGKDILVGGLYADYTSTPFAEMVNLMAHANVKFLTALCKECKDGTEAIYTKYIGETHCEENDDSRLIVGGAEKYMAVCSKHFLGFE